MMYDVLLECMVAFLFLLGFISFRKFLNEQQGVFHSVSSYSMSHMFCVGIAFIQACLSDATPQCFLYINTPYLQADSHLQITC